MQKVILKPALADYLLTLSTHRRALERIRRTLLYATLLFKPKKISDVLPSSQRDSQLRVIFQNTEPDRKCRTPLPHPDADHPRGEQE